jgi:GTP-binding protein LepA
MDNIRNFCIIAHIDHGKSTLADRLLEMTGTIEKRKMKDQVLDTMDLERERGITIKLQPATMIHRSSQTNADLTQTNAENKEEFLYEDLTFKIRGAAFEVKKQLGLGHKENVYQNALEIEFKKRGLNVEKEKGIVISYEGNRVGMYRPDFIIDDKVIVELKALPFIGKKEEKQMWTYLKGSKYKLLLLINFSSEDVYFRRIVFDTARALKSQRNSASSQRESAQVKNYVLNLIDTPGHVDFGYEVSRSLAAVEGAVLLVDATKGVQAQTLANLYQAVELGLEIVPVVNKIDLPNAQVEKTKSEIVSILGCRPEEIILASGKTGEGVDKILRAIVERVPAPVGSPEKPLRALVFDSKYDPYKGVLAYVRVVDGEIKKEDKLFLMVKKVKAEALEVGRFRPQLEPDDKLETGQIGYVATGLRSVEECRVGDTITLSVISNFQFPISNKSTKDGIEKELKTNLQPLSGYKEVRPMVYASFYPQEGEDYNQMRDALEKLKLNDAALTFEGESSLALGRGFRLGFLGLLHLEIIQERLKREFGFQPIITTPSVVYEVVRTSGETEKIYSASEMPDAGVIKEIREPYANLEILTPAQYLGDVMKLVGETTRSSYLSTEYIDKDRVSLKFNSPLSEIIVNFHDALKSVSKGFASMNYEISDYKPYDLVRLDVYVAEEKVDAFAQIVPREKAFSEGRKIVKKLKEVIPRQNFMIKLQAAIGGKVIARESISAFRKDVTGHLYGGDITRKRKLLEKQKKGKKRMTASGRAHIPQEAFLKVLKN